MRFSIFCFCKQCKVQPLEPHKQFPLFSSPLSHCWLQWFRTFQWICLKNVRHFSWAASLLELNLHCVQHPNASGCGVNSWGNDIFFPLQGGIPPVEEASEDLCCGYYLYCGNCRWFHPVLWWWWNMSVRGDVMLWEFRHLSFQGIDQ